MTKLTSVFEYKPDFSPGLYFVPMRTKNQESVICPPRPKGSVPLPSNTIVVTTANNTNTTNVATANCRSQLQPLSHLPICLETLRNPFSTVVWNPFPQSKVSLLKSELRGAFILNMSLSRSPFSSTRFVIITTFPHLIWV